MSSRLEISRGLESDIKASANAIRSLESELVGKTEAITTLEHELGVWREKLADTEAMLKERDATIANLAADISSKPVSSESLEELRESTDTIRDLESKLGAKAERIRVLEADVERLKDKQAERKRSAVDQKSAITKLEASIAEKSESIRLLEQELRHWQDKHASLERMSTSQDSGLAEMKSQLEAGVATSRQLETDLLTKTSALDRHIERLDAAQVEIDNWKRSHDELKETLAAREGALKRLEGRAGQRRRDYPGPGERTPQPE